MREEPQVDLRLDAGERVAPDGVVVHEQRLALAAARHEMADPVRVRAVAHLFLAALAPGVPWERDAERFVDARGGPPCIVPYSAVRVAAAPVMDRRQLNLYGNQNMRLLEDSQDEQLLDASESRPVRPSNGCESSGCHDTYGKINKYGISKS